MPASTINLRELQAPIKARYLEHPDEAVIECAPSARAAVVKRAIPEASRPAVPSGEPPSKNVTVPVGVPGCGAPGP